MVLFQHIYTELCQWKPVLELQTNRESSVVVYRIQVLHRYIYMLKK